MVSSSSYTPWNFWSEAAELRSRLIFEGSASADPDYHRSQELGLRFPKLVLLSSNSHLVTVQPKFSLGAHGLICSVQTLTADLGAPDRGPYSLTKSFLASLDSFYS